MIDPTRVRGRCRDVRRAELGLIGSGAAAGCRRYVVDVRRPKRAGTALICAMVALVVVSAMVGSLLQLTLQTQKRTKLAAQSLQVEWLVQAALERSMRGLRQSPDYAGETWDLPADHITGTHSGHLEIQVEPGATSDQREIRIMAEYPSDAPTSIRKSHTFSVNIPHR